MTKDKIQAMLLILEINCLHVGIEMVRDGLVSAYDELPSAFTV